MSKTWSIWGNSIKNNAQQIFKYLKNENPVVLCLGTNKILEDALGPMVGSMLKKLHYSGFVYGTLDAPISCLNLKVALKFIKATHKDKKILIVDASTTSHLERIGKIVLAKNYKPFNETLYSQDVSADYFLFGVCSLFKKHFKTLYNAKQSIIQKLCKTICYGIMFDKIFNKNFNKNFSLKNQQYFNQKTAGA